MQNAKAAEGRVAKKKYEKNTRARVKSKYSLLIATHTVHSKLYTLYMYVMKYTRFHTLPFNITHT